MHINVVRRAVREEAKTPDSTMYVADLCRVVQHSCIRLSVAHIIQYAQQRHIRIMTRGRETPDYQRCHVSLLDTPVEQAVGILNK